MTRFNLINLFVYNIYINETKSIHTLPKKKKKEKMLYRAVG